MVKFCETEIFKAEEFIEAEAKKCFEHFSLPRGGPVVYSGGNI